MSRSVLFVNLRRIKREGQEALLAARALGYRVVVLGRALPAFAEPLVDSFHQVDTYDTERSVKLARELAAEHDIAGVPNFTEVDVRLVSAIATDLGLPALPAEAALAARNKYVMKQAISGKVDVLPAYERVTDLAGLRAAVERIGLPAVVKPTGASGSKGIFELRSEADLEPAMTELLRIADPGFDPVFQQFGAEFIVEEYLDGVELSVEGFVAAGQVHVVGITDKVTTDPFHLELTHRFPSALPTDAQATISRQAGEVVRALGFDNCAFHLEAKWGERGMRFLEVAARPAGDYIGSHLVPAATGIPFFENVIRVATGEPLRLTPDRDLHAGLRFVLAGSAGTYAGLDGVAELVDAPGYDHVFTEVPVGAAVKLPPADFGSQRVAAVCARHVHRAGLDALLDAVPEVVTARVTAG
ncbi:ATP-grasp domain-containing protein [Actinokineospora bangkokensis]|uniref:Phosphoribosylglycinamide synthetase n=1 Tax=Actinokineospora bangkokensis TaxID=1193682 RepID=A0A1Q9LJR9_9PSEU|nr:ATP-grasp domain-containing protein [Actinokineospora bangkokensis]OLR92244.1 phosphoribosylglycinamide synthetase [Actinokineospora bangkokensis]